MESLTGLTGFYWILFFGYALAVVFAVESARREPDGARLGRLLAVPLVVGATLAAFLLRDYRSETGHLLRHVADQAGSVPVALVALVGAVAVADLFFARFALPLDRATAGLGLSRRSRADLALVVGVGAPTAVIIAILPQIDQHFAGLAQPQPQSQSGTTETAASNLVADYRLPGQPLDLVLRGATSGYVSFGQGTVARIDLPADAAHEPRVTPVATGLQWPRGLAIVGTRLFVAELGPLPCRPAFPRCKGGDVATDVSDGEREIIRTSRGRVLAFDIDADGDLSNRRVVLRDFPVVNTDHGLNDLALGTDGRVYLAIGHLDTTYASEKVKRDLARPHADLLGTVVSFKPDGGGMRVHAKGLRNVYGLAFDSRGRLYGADNNGPTRSGSRPEELLRIERGADYGYPDAPRRPSTPPALRPLRVAGSGGIAWLPGAGGGRLLLGYCGGIDRVRLSIARDGEPRVTSGADVARLHRLPGCVTAIGSRPGRLAVSIFTAGSRGKIYLFPSPRS